MAKKKYKAIAEGSLLIADTVGMWITGGNKTPGEVSSKSRPVTHISTVMMMEINK